VSHARDGDAGGAGRLYGHRRSAEQHQPRRNGPLRRLRATDHRPGAFVPEASLDAGDWVIILDNSSEGKAAPTTDGKRASATVEFEYAVTAATPADVTPTE
jgi:hypothetical protein